MKRVFSCVVVKMTSFPYFKNDFISSIYENIHNNGGEVLTMNISAISNEPFGGEHLLITYDDHDNYEAINKLLADKKDDITKLLY